MYVFKWLITFVSDKLKKAIEQNNMEGAKIYAENAIRNKNEELNYLKLASRVDAVAARVNTAAKMGTLTKSMSGVTKALDSCMKQFSLEKVKTTSSLTRFCSKLKFPSFLHRLLWPFKN